MARLANKTRVLVIALKNFHFGPVAARLPVEIRVFGIHP